MEGGRGGCGRRWKAVVVGCSGKWKVVIMVIIGDWVAKWWSGWDVVGDGRWSWWDVVDLGNSEGRWQMMVVEGCFGDDRWVLAIGVDCGGRR